MSGETEAHLQLERELAEFVEKEAAYLLNFGYQGIVSIIDALVTRRDVIVYDADCLELCRNILKEKPDCKIIILTGYDYYAFEKEAKKSGAVGFLTLAYSGACLYKVYSLGNIEGLRRAL